MSGAQERSMTIADEKLAEIRAGLEGVTPGPWNAYADECEQCRKEGICEANIDGISSGNHGQFYHLRDAEHIARLDPATVSSLLARLERAEAERDEAKKEAQQAVLSMLFMPGVRAALDNLPPDDPIEPYLERIKVLEAAESSASTLSKRVEELEAEREEARPHVDKIARSLASDGRGEGRDDV